MRYFGAMIGLVAINTIFEQTCCGRTRSACIQACAATLQFMKRIMKPMIKWTGGKRNELPLLRPHYPQGFKRIIEPFAGGAAVAWDLDGVPAIINDVNTDLIRFYQSMQDPQARPGVRTALTAINARRLHGRQWVAQLSADQVGHFFSSPEAWAAKHHCNLTSPATLAAIDFHLESLLAKHATSKARRIKKIQADRGEAFTLQERRDHLETAVHSAFYEALRCVYNRQIKVPAAWAVAAWWSVRILCYSGMFRFSSKGLFNVPYGGTSYNARDLAASFETLFGEERVAELARFTVESMDFESLFHKYNGFDAGDFVFVDPPYDTTFSQYNQAADFTRNDQERLRDTLLACHGKWMLVIKRTDYIQSLYEHSGHHCFVFDKQYMVNFRNRHDRGVQHLVVTNYPLALDTNQALRPL